MANDPASAQSAARRARFLGASKTGAGDDWRMRVSSIALLPLSIAFIWMVLSLLGKDYAEARAVLGTPFAALLMLLFVATGVFHMKLGMQSIIDDYVHSTHLKDLSLIANLFFSVCVGLACVYAILKLSFT
jgi:succinate dehydrogenase / fumarate reductase membrane anchor subunit